MKKINIREIVTLSAPQKYINGTAWISSLINESSAGCSLSSVTFEPGARTHWHSHPTVQILMAQNGVGYVQKRNELKQLMQPGDVVVIYPGEEHWHGATPESMFSHLAIQMEKDEGIIISKVTNEEYLAPPGSRYIS